MRCENCRYWVNSNKSSGDGKRRGLCHFNPPAAGAAQPFPNVNHDEFCSRFKSNIKPGEVIEKK